MSKKRVSYQNLLKEAISEFDTSKTVDVKGPTEPYEYGKARPGKTQNR